MSNTSWPHQIPRELLPQMEGHWKKKEEEFYGSFYVVLLCFPLFYSSIYILAFFFISCAISSDVTCKPLTSDCIKEVHHRKGKKLSPGIVVPLTLGSDSEVTLGSSGIQVHDSTKVAPVPKTELAKRNSCNNSLASLSRTSVQEVLTKNRSEVDHIESSDGNMMTGATLVADPVSGMKNVSLPSLFDPDVPLTPSRAGFKEETNTNGAVTNFSGVSDSLVSVVDNDCKSSFTEVEFPVDTSFYIQDIMEEMRSIPNLLSPLNPEPETVRSHCQGMYYLLHLYLQNSSCLLDRGNF
jgi:hypothetical protein